jgi:hypothetical protein
MYNFSENWSCFLYDEYDKAKKITCKTIILVASGFDRRMYSGVYFLEDTGNAGNRAYAG